MKCHDHRNGHGWGVLDGQQGGDHSAEDTVAFVGGTREAFQMVLVPAEEEDEELF